MVISPKLSFVANGNNLTDVGLAPGETIFLEAWSSPPIALAG
jgi:hypothetical protein